MPNLTEEQLFLADLKDNLFICYVVVAPAGSDAWKTARRASAFTTQVNLYRFDDHTVLKPFLGTSKPVGMTFSKLGKPVTRLNEASATDLYTVLGAMKDALRVEE